MTASPWNDEAREEIELTREVLRLTAPSEPVLDQKGETVFRRRACYLAFEGITNRKMRLGLLKDTVQPSLIHHQVHVVASANCLPRRVRRFVGENYLPLGRLRVAGRVLPGADAGTATTAQVAVAGSYVVIGQHGVTAASVDGQPATTIHRLSAGEHQLVLSEDCDRPVILWSGALRAYSGGELAALMNRQMPPLDASPRRRCCGHKGWVAREMRRLDRTLNGRVSGFAARRPRS